MVGVSEHDDRFDPAVQTNRYILCGGMHNPGPLRVTDQGELLVWAIRRLGHEAAHNIGGTPDGATDDIGTGRVLQR